MFAPFVKYQKFIGLVVIVIFLLMVIGWTRDDRERLTFIEEAVITVTSPVQSAVSGVGGRIQAAYTFISELQEMSEENRELREQVKEYESLKVEAEELRLENHRLRSLLDFEEHQEYDLKPAKVIGRSADSWNRTVVINRGKKHGVETNMSVVTDEGLVGQVISVSSSTSKVLLLIDPDSAVSGLVQDTRETGIVEGKDVGANELQMVNLPKDAEVEIGEIIISSGFGPVFPKGLVIGEVIDLEEEMSGFTNRAIIKPAVNFGRLEEVFVVLSGSTAIELDEEELQNFQEENDEEITEDEPEADNLEEDFNEGETDEGQD